VRQLLTILRLRLASIFRRRRVDAAVDEELQFHLDQAAEARERQGHGPDEARRLALADLGGLESPKEACRETRGFSWHFDVFRQDVRISLRMLRKTPAVSAVARLVMYLAVCLSTLVLRLLGPPQIERDGVVVLSENTGAYEELQDWVVRVNPFDVAGQAEALSRALSMSRTKRHERLEAIRAYVREHDVAAWIEGQLADLDRCVAGVSPR